MQDKLVFNRIYRVYFGYHTGSGELAYESAHLFCFNMYCLTGNPEFTLKYLLDWWQFVCKTKNYGIHMCYTPVFRRLLSQGCSRPHEILSQRKVCKNFLKLSSRSPTIMLYSPPYFFNHLFTRLNWLLNFLFSFTASKFQTRYPHNISALLEFYS